uniref:Uncharacterized protein n=1 Tax=Arundo donax TaxID=35708 RepID=A0A0A9GE91_ARUDO
MRQEEREAAAARQDAAATRERKAAARERKATARERKGAAAAGSGPGSSTGGAAAATGSGPGCAPSMLAVWRAPPTASCSAAPLPPSATSSSPAPLPPIHGLEHGGMLIAMEARCLLRLCVLKLLIWHRGKITIFSFFSSKMKELELILCSVACN